MTSGPSTYHSLQSARALAALMVVAFHSILAFVLAQGDVGTSLPRIGASGVDIFFVLSGFVIQISTAGRDTHPLDFYRKRILRIAPLYWFYTMALVAVATVMPAVFRTVRVDSEHLLASLFFVPWRNSGVLLGTFRDHMVPILVPGWSLNYEMYFYLLFGITLLAPPRYRLPGSVFLIAGVTLLCAALRDESDILRFYASPLVAEFLAGLLIARWAKSSRRLLPAMVMVPVLAISGVLLLVAERYGGDLRIIPAVCIVFSLVALERRGALRRLPKLELLGDASYSLYLTHVFVVGALRVIAARTDLDKIGGLWLAQIFFVIVCLLASSIVGLATYRWVERPLLKLFGR